MKKAAIILLAAALITTVGAADYAILSGSFPKAPQQSNAPAAPIDPAKEAQSADLSFLVKRNVTAEAEPIPENGNPRPHIAADITLDGKTLHIKQQVTLPEQTDRFHIYLPASNHAAVNIKGVYSPEGIISYENQNNTNIFVNPKSPARSVSLDYDVTLSESNGEILSYNDGMVLLCYFLAEPSVNINGQPFYYYTSKLGDPYISDLTDYDIAFTAPSEYTPFAPGKQSEKYSDGMRTTNYSIQNIRDFAIVAAINPTVTVVESGKALLCFVNAQPAEAYVLHSFTFASENIGSYPYPELFIVKAPISLKGMEMSNMVLLADKSFQSPEILKNVAYHEVFHQWFYGIIGTDQFNEPYFDEGITTFLSNYLTFTLAQNTNLFDLRRNPLNAYSDNRSYTIDAYTNSSRYFTALFNRYPKESEFFDILHEIYQQRAFTRLSFDEFISYFK